MEEDEFVVEENFPDYTNISTNIDYELGEKLYNEYVEVVEENGEEYEIVYYDKFWNVVPKEDSVTSVKRKKEVRKK